jgi:hypothetical protein
MIDLTTILTTGGPIGIILAVLGWGTKEFIDWQKRKQQDLLDNDAAEHSGAKTSAETDSVVVQATKDVVTMIRGELTSAAERISSLENDNRRLRTDNDLLLKENQRLTNLAQLRLAADNLDAS